MVLEHTIMHQGEYTRENSPEINFKDRGPTHSLTIPNTLVCSEIAAFMVMEHNYTNTAASGRNISGSTSTPRQDAYTWSEFVRNYCNADKPSVRTLSDKDGKAQEWAHGKINKSWCIVM